MQSLETKSFRPRPKSFETETETRPETFETRDRDSCCRQVLPQQKLMYIKAISLRKW